MSVYAPLNRYLGAVMGDAVPLTFAEIEAILGRALPPSARRHPAWWSNNVGTHVNAAAWRDAGWRTSQVSIPDERVTFLRDASAGQPFDWTPRQGGGATQMPGMSEAPRAFDEIAIAPAGLSRSALAMIDDLAEEMGAGRAQAVARILDACALERRRRMLEDLPVARMPAGHDSTRLIREDRDSR